MYAKSRINHTSLIHVSRTWNRNLRKRRGDDVPSAQRWSTCTAAADAGDTDVDTFNQSTNQSFTCSEITLFKWQTVCQNHQRAGQQGS